MSTHIEIIATAFLEAHASARRHKTLFAITFADLCRILEHYDEPWRHYHTIEHIADGCRKLLDVRGMIDDFPGTLLAWIFHDIVFVPGSSRNEELSAELARKYLAGKVDECMLARIMEMIRATTTHIVPENFEGHREDLAILLSVDLSGLADPHDDFVHVGELIRKELDITPEEWEKGRAGFAGMLLARKAVYPAVCFEHLETSAKRNLDWAVEVVAGS